MSAFIFVSYFWFWLSPRADMAGLAFAKRPLFLKALCTFWRCSCSGFALIPRMADGRVLRHSRLVIHVGDVWIVVSGQETGTSTAVVWLEACC